MKNQILIMIIKLVHQYKKYVQNVKLLLIARKMNIVGVSNSLINYKSQIIVNCDCLCKNCVQQSLIHLNKDSLVLKLIYK